MKNQFKKKMLKLIEKHDKFMFDSWAGYDEKGRKWKFCPLATVAVELGLNRRQLIRALKNDSMSAKDVENLVFNYMESHGFPKNKSAIFMTIWDTLNYKKNKNILSGHQSLEFSALMADKYNCEIKNDLDYNSLVELADAEFGDFLTSYEEEYVY